ncbi:MAG: hypothetical protein A2W18_15155 [Candidatus Muproteobacteria bacterium RBG_16_60_9]|uniref:NAD-dependent epimerase/dehydratase domain-containing protein n=1 Tax=Candidatus Muproteobacteria bacterium RBG_16_60_9 TaxID=1817755 RepID=A0A1F6UWE5_9PROT|nr:MAG: hypothetical protein A2W18_15155 [Candidatus Muproteobacteria bacterium RBG_16_60_9]
MKDETKLAGRVALVTGAAGFIGSALCRALNTAGATVHGVSRSPRESDRNMRWWQCDMLEVNDVRRIVSEAQPDVVFHLASQVTGLRSVDAVLPIFQANLVTTVNLLSALVGSGCERVVLTGSLEEPELDETAPVPCSPYAAAKFAAGVYGRMFHGLYNLPVVILKLFMVYGPAQQDVKKLIPYVTLSLLRGCAPDLSSGTREIDWVYVDDVVGAYLSAATAKGAVGHTIDIGSGSLVSARTIVEQLVEMINPRICPKFGAIPERPMEQVRVAKLAQAATLLDWKPRIQLREGLQRTVSWYRASVRDNAPSLVRSGER